MRFFGKSLPFRLDAINSLFVRVNNRGWSRKSVYFFISLIRTSVHQYLLKQPVHSVAVLGTTFFLVKKLGFFDLINSVVAAINVFVVVVLL